MIWMHQTLPCSGRDRVLCVLCALVCCLLWPGVSLAVLDICDCTGLPSLGAFDSSNSSTYPPGTTVSSGVVTIPLPQAPDDRLVFSSFTVANSNPVKFGRNDANTPVTLLVTGNVTIGTSPTSGILLNVAGNAGLNGGASSIGLGGLGGPGGLRGGEGAFPAVTLANDGGPGLGLGGGAAGIASPLAPGGGATFGGSFQLLPLIGGSGGGGGAANPSSCATSTAAGGGGGGGGGALLIAANGTITLDALIFADGGNGGGQSNASCASAGGGGSGGAVRLLADTITSTTGGGFFRVLARGGFQGDNSSILAGAGIIRMEAFTNTLNAGDTIPLAQRIGGPGPVTVPLPQTIAITMVNGQSVPQPPQGSIGGIDVVVLTPGVIPIDLETSGVPGGTVVTVKVKPQVGGAPIVQNVTLAPSDCDNAGVCAATVMVNLSSGAHFIEAQATFQTP